MHALTPCGTAAQLYAAQALHDNMAPAEPDEDWLSPDQAEERARDMLASTPAVVAEWLWVECQEDRADLDTYALQQALKRGDRELSVPELLAVLMDGYDDNLQRVRYALRQKFNAAQEEAAAEMAATILAEQERAARQ
jgi:hypothetical protein